LKLRHKREIPYTRTGDIIIAVNPYQWLHELYTEEKKSYYANRLVWETSEEDRRATMQPHVYEVSALAYKGLALGDGENQSILVSGESGAGKTETIKICLGHIASIQRGQVPPGYYEDAEHDGVVKRVVESNPLLEAFGNAKTRRNDNSSRFGKYLQLQFDASEAKSRSDRLVLQSERSRLVGSKCDVYLLEKNRVVSHDERERSFHIFYQLLSASDAVKAQFWQGLLGKTSGSFKYIGASKTDAIEGVHDRDQFEHALNALAIVGVQGESLKILMQALCIVMQLGNLSFEELDGDSDKSAVASSKELSDLAALMELSEKDLILSFTERTLVTDKESHKVQLNPEAAKDACDALAKDAYQKAFLWVVKHINKATCAMETSGNPIGTIGLLDIFGFEAFEKNGFEQLCINYANEKLQEKFNFDCFTNVKLEYKAEGVSLEDVWYDDNRDVLDLIEGPTGLLALLNEECIRPKGNDLDFVHKSFRMNKSSPAMVVHKTNRMSFAIRHFAGQVLYDAECFVSKNLDTLPTDLQVCAERCSNAIIREPRSEHEMCVKKNIGSHWQQKQSNIIAPTAWTKYKSQLSTLMSNLRQTRSRYIRCIKPNSKKEAGLMEHSSTVEQLRCSGVVAAILISRSAFPNRLPNSVVLARFSHLWDTKNYKSKTTDDMTLVEKRRCDCHALLDGALKSKEAVNPKNDKVIKAFAVGKTKTFFRQGVLEWLEAHRMRGLDQHATTIQRMVKRWLLFNAGRHKRQLREMENARLAALRRHEDERRALLAKERAARKRKLQRMVDQVAMLEVSFNKYTEDQDQKVHETETRNHHAQKELEELKATYAKAEDRGVDQRLIERAEQERMLAENKKLIAYLMKENQRARKENAKIKSKLDIETEKKLRSGSSCDSTRAQKEMENAEIARAKARKRLTRNAIEAAKTENVHIGDHLNKEQQRYLMQAQARLKLQKALGKIVAAVQSGVPNRSLVEDVIVTALKAEALGKSVMAGLDIASLEPDLTSSDMSCSSISEVESLSDSWLL
jgi:myosin V